jgi:dipeptidyl aminopeptidase/acylaminoacyl peptidase
MLQSIYTSFDAAAAIDPEITNRVAIGHSAGGYYALMLGIKDVKLLRIRRSHIPNKIIAQAPLTDLWRGQQERLSDNGDAIKKFIDSQRAEPASQNIYALMSPLQHPPSDKCTIHLVHGKMDTDVPLDQSIAYSNRFGNFPGTLFLHEFPEANHYDIVNVEHLAWKAQQTMLLV